MKTYIQFINEELSEDKYEIKYEKWKKHEPR